MVATLSTDELKRQLGELEVSVRADLAKFLIDSLPVSEKHWTPEEWEAELDRRLDEIRTGRVRGMPAHEVIAEIRKKYS